MCNGPGPRGPLRRTLSDRPRISCRPGEAARAGRASPGRRGRQGGSAAPRCARRSSSVEANSRELIFATSCPRGAAHRHVGGHEADTFTMGSRPRAARARRPRSQRTGSPARRYRPSGPTPSNTTTPRAPLSATKLASESISSSRSAMPAAWRTFVTVEQIQRRIRHGAAPRP